MPLPALTVLHPLRLVQPYSRLDPNKPTRLPLTNNTHLSQEGNRILPHQGRAMMLKAYFRKMHHLPMKLLRP